MEAVFKSIKGMSPGSAVIILILTIILVVFSKSDKIINFIKWIAGKGSKKKTSCGDCVLILFGIREKFEYQIRRLDTGLLRSQMKFSEQKIQEAIFFLSQTFSDDIMVIGAQEKHEKRIMEVALYCEALKNAMLSVKDELRRSFKENGFGAYSEVEFTSYVKSKTRTLITIIRLYLNQYYIDGENTIMHLKDRFNKMDKLHYQKLEGWTFEIFSNAKDAHEDTKQKKKELDSHLKKEIDEFVTRGGSSEKC